MRSRSWERSARPFSPRRAIRRLPLAAGLWAVAWLAHGLVAQAAGVALIGLAAVTVAQLVARVAPDWSIAAGLVVVAIVDIVLVWATPQVQPASNALHAAALPSLAGHAIPPLQDATFGSATMGWLDLVAPALLGVVVRARLAAAVLTGLAAGAWGLLLLGTSTVPATVPGCSLALLFGRVRIAVFSDVHANLAALEAVLAEIDAASPDELWCLGDVVGYGPRPNECCELVARTRRHLPRRKPRSRRARDDRPRASSAATPPRPRAGRRAS